MKLLRAVLDGLADLLDFGGTARRPPPRRLIMTSRQRQERVWQRLGERLKRVTRR